MDEFGWTHEVRLSNVPALEQGQPFTRCLNF